MSTGFDDQGVQSAPLPALTPLPLRGGHRLLSVLALVAVAALGLILPGAVAGPSGKTGILVYASVRSTGESQREDPDDFTDLFTVRADGSGLRRLTRTALWEESPAWAPDGRLIAYSRAVPFCHASSCNWAPLGANVWVMAADGRGGRALTDGEEDDFFDEYPTWAPDGKRVAFTRTREADDRWDGIYAVGVDGSGLVRLSTTPATSLAWSPNGSTIAYVHGDGHLGLLDLATRRERRLRVRGISRARSVEWSPRGRFLAVTTGKALLVVRAAGGGARTIVEAQKPGSVAWSPDGCCLAFSATRTRARSTSGRIDLYVVSVRGGHARRLTGNPGPDLSPDWRR